MEWLTHNLWWMSLVVEAIICILIACYMFHHYGSYKKLSIYVPILAIPGWVMCFMMVFLIPLDVVVSTPGCNQYASCTSTPNFKCTFEADEIYKVLPMMWIWRILYWSTFFLTWAIYPIMQSYSMAGEFSWGEKFRSAIRSNVLLYSICLCFLVIFVIAYFVWNYRYHKESLSYSELSSVLIAAGNMWGLFIVISLLGHGLVNVPRNLWRKANKPMCLRQLCFEAVGLSYKLEDSKKALVKTLKKVRKAAEITAEADPYRKYVDIVISKCPEEYENVLYGEGNVEITYGKLAALHARIIDENHQVDLWQSRYNSTLDYAFELQDILRSKNSNLGYIEWSFRPTWQTMLQTVFNRSAPRVSPQQQNKVLSRMEYWYYCHLEGIMLRSLSLLCMILGILIAWSELVFFIKKIDLSIFSLIVRIPRIAYVLNGVVLQGTVFIPVVYITLCVTASLFRLRLFDYYHLVPDQKSNANSLLFSASYLCRTTAPIAYNFLMMIHYCDTPFLEIMGKLNLVPLVGTVFQDIFPILLVPFSLLTLFNVYSRVLNCLNIRRFQFDEDFTDSQIEEGEELVALERDRRIRGLIQETSMSTIRKKGMDSQNEGIKHSSASSVSSTEVVESGDHRYPNQSIIQRVKGSITSLFSSNKVEKSYNETEITEMSIPVANNDRMSIAERRMMGMDTTVNINSSSFNKPAFDSTKRRSNNSNDDFDELGGPWKDDDNPFA